MGRILAIDYGTKRTGIAVTDPLKIIATALTTVDTQTLFEFLKSYIEKEEVEKIIIGEPRNLDGSPTDATAAVLHTLRRLKNSFPHIPVEKVDEAYSSKRAKEAMVQMGMKKKDRQQKGNTDQIAACILLQEYLERIT